MSKKKLTLKQQKFADEYIITGNIYKSAVKAGYSKAYARGNAAKLMENVSIKKYIDERLEEIKSEKVADQQEIMEFLTAVMRGEVDEPMPLLDGDGYQKVVKVTPNAQARKSAAELLGKRYAMWTDKRDVNVAGAVTFVDDIGDEDET
ncbi:terminase small subunit [Oceanobacillus sp. J11TS1]|uniref:terminase small subunit n=1 Tax=Oceanobacillus sp. J11TS1 TaxID=2807191 RepID=UPI001B122393|nr:terminase small subunit [Oceanobacillus sp. J11TS1]GIO25112.1 terminase small subunit [Oceanobacillus sp. J11TS1]